MAGQIIGNQMPSDAIRCHQSTCSTFEWPGIGTGCPEASNRPMRGPMMVAPAKAPIPPVICTTPEPAKSRKRKLASSFVQESQPEWDHT